MNSITDIVAKARRDTQDRLGTDVEVLDDLGNTKGMIRAIIGKGPEAQSDAFGVSTPYRIKFFVRELPDHQQGLQIKSWRGTFCLHALLERDAGRVTYSLRTV